MSAGNTRLLVADLDNNAAGDLVISSPAHRESRLEERVARSARSIRRVFLAG